MSSTQRVITWRHVAGMIVAGHGALALVGAVITFFRIMQGQDLHIFGSLWSPTDAALYNWAVTVLGVIYLVLGLSLAEGAPGRAQIALWLTVLLAAALLIYGMSTDAETTRIAVRLIFIGAILWPAAREEARQRKVADSNHAEHTTG